MSSWKEPDIKCEGCGKKIPWGSLFFRCKKCRKKIGYPR